LIETAIMEVSQVVMQSIDMHKAPCGTVAASSQGALPRNMQMATIAAGVRLHQCHETYLDGLSETAIKEYLSNCNSKH
jgi:hypothetical protein